jgi:hypothetical protein
VSGGLQSVSVLEGGLSRKHSPSRATPPHAPKSRTTAPTRETQGFSCEKARIALLHKPSKASFEEKRERGGEEENTIEHVVES